MSLRMPTPSQMMWPVLEAVRALGGSSHISEISVQVAKQEGFAEELLGVMHKPGSPQTEIDYRLAWARTQLKNIGALVNSSRGVWALTELGRNLTREQVENPDKQPMPPPDPDAANSLSTDPADPDDPDGDPDKWRTDLLEHLLRMPPDAFERLAQRLLREAGFRNVEVLGRSGDGGIDGVGVYRLSLVSFPTFFQCKRYRSSVSSGAVRDFRGAMSGRGDKGLLITTGSFTRSACEEATRDGAPPVDLVSGDELCDLLKEYRLGVKVIERVIEDIEIVPGFFDQF